MEFYCDLLFLNGMLGEKNCFLQRKIFEQIISRHSEVLILEVLTNEHELIDFEMHLTFHHKYNSQSMLKKWSN